MKPPTVMIIYFLTLGVILNIAAYSELRYYRENYGELDNVLKSIAEREYTDTYQCEQFSKDLVEALADKGIQASVMYGESPITKQQPDVAHAWTAIWFESQSGKLTKNYEQN